MIENAGYSMPKELANFKLIKEFRTCAVNYKYPGEREYSQLFVIKITKCRLKVGSGQCIMIRFYNIN